MNDKVFSILVVDDTEMNRDLLERRLRRQGYAVFMAENGKEAIEKVKNYDFDLILLDIMMPVMDGYNTLEMLKSSDKYNHIPVIMITAINEMDSVVRCLELGAEDYLPKPFNPILLKARITASLEKKVAHDLRAEYQRNIEEHNNVLERRVREQVKEIGSAHLAAIFAMSKLAESRDTDTGSHLERIREYCRVLSEELSLVASLGSEVNDRFIENIYSASPLHDIGKVGVPDHVLQKPGKLTDDEWNAMKTHAVIGAETLRAVDAQHPGNAFIRMGIEIAEGHHEKWDGSGYPHGLAGEAIRLSARIVALGDVYDALTSKRCYKSAFSHEKATDIILSSSGSHFDPDIVRVFLRREAEFRKIRLTYQEGGG
ncbi:MAG: response regulator [Magnetospirillum sp.]|nr:response regulator [Magnetospirillum sp.]